MTFTLYKITERHTKGCIEDESEIFSYETQYRLLENGSKEEQDFHESMASDYGYQDYNFSIGCKKVAEFYSLNDAREYAKAIIQNIDDIENKIINQAITIYETDQFGDIVEEVLQ